MNKAVTERKKLEWDNEYIQPADYDEIKNKVLESELESFKAICDIAMSLHKNYIINSEKCNGNFFITVRPDDNKCTFEEFYKLLYKFVNRKSINKYVLTLEQKGLDIEHLGNGFHAHIICQTSFSGKQNALRDTISTFKKVCNANCIQVDYCKNPEELKNKYLIEYESNDQHKIVTKEMDNLWRKQKGLRDIYENDLPPLSVIIKSKITDSNIILKLE